MRLFISVDINDSDIQDELVTFTNILNRYDGIKTVHPENFHLTLLFLGERSRENIDEIREQFQTAMNHVDSHTFQCTVSGVSVFPHMNYIKTVWASCKPRSELLHLHTRLREFMNEESEHEFTPHITLGRVKYVNTREKERLQELLAERDPEFGTFQVTDVRLKQSILTESGPEYKDLEVCEL